MIEQPTKVTEVCWNQGCQYFLQQELLKRAAALLTRPMQWPEWRHDREQWLRDAGVEK